jgi:hypothetical protein
MAVFRHLASDLTPDRGVSGRPGHNQEVKHERIARVGTVTEFLTG